MKAKHTIFYFLCLALLSPLAKANQQQAQESSSNAYSNDMEFFEFLADMEETTGTGFERWLEDGSDIDSGTNSNVSTDTTEQQQ